MSDTIRGTVEGCEYSTHQDDGTGVRVVAVDVPADLAPDLSEWRDRVGEALCELFGAIEWDTLDEAMARADGIHDVDAGRTRSEFILTVERWD